MDLHNEKGYAGVYIPSIVRIKRALLCFRCKEIYCRYDNLIREMSNLLDQDHFSPRLNMNRRRWYLACTLVRTALPAVPRCKLY